MEPASSATTRTRACAATATPRSATSERAHALQPGRERGRGRQACTEPALRRRPHPARLSHVSPPVAPCPASPPPPPRLPAGATTALCCSPASAWPAPRTAPSAATQKRAPSEWRRRSGCPSRLNAAQLLQPVILEQVIGLRALAPRAVARAAARAVPSAPRERPCKSGASIQGRKAALWLLPSFASTKWWCSTLARLDAA